MAQENSSKEIPTNFHYDYRGIRHVESPLNVSSEDDWRETIREKYRKIDSGETKPKHHIDSKKDLKTDGELNQMMQKLIDKQSSPDNSEIDSLKAQVEKLTELVNSMVPNTIKNDEPEVKPEEKVGVIMQKYTVAKAKGVGWYDVKDDDGIVINDKAMRKTDAEELADQRNAA